MEEKKEKKTEEDNYYSRNLKDFPSSLGVYSCPGRTNKLQEGWMERWKKDWSMLSYLHKGILVVKTVGHSNALIRGQGV